MKLEWEAVNANAIKSLERQQSLKPVCFKISLKDRRVRRKNEFRVPTSIPTYVSFTPSHYVQ